MVNGVMTGLFSASPSRPAGEYHPALWWFPDAPALSQWGKTPIALRLGFLDSHSQLKLNEKSAAHFTGGGGF
jgi:hypothetical protein